MKKPDLSFIITEDGSPSIDWEAGQSSETMHSRAGALSESDYIYGDALRLLVEKQWPPRVLSMGLGLAYNEFFTIGLVDQPSITSFEKDELLRNHVKGWLSGEDKNEPYQTIIDLIAERIQLPPSEVKEKAQNLYLEKSWQIHDELHFDLKQRFSAILYDAFSGKSQPELWSEETIDHLLTSYANSKCIFATYAATGNLKRVLKSHGFQVLKRSGFAGKRESTLAIRQ